MVTVVVKYRYVQTYNMAVCNSYKLRYELLPGTF